METERRFELRISRMRDLNPNFIPDDDIPRFDRETTEQSIILNLFYVNLWILVMSSLAGYFLAGRTLTPIKEMVDKQNQFVADASHELRTPLTALQTAIEVNLRDKSLNLKQAKDILKENLDDVERLKNLSNNLLTLTKLNANDSYILEKVSLNEVIEQAIREVSYLAKNKKIEIKTSLKDVTISGDKSRLKELFVIFLDNAIKYSNNDQPISVKSFVKGTSVYVDVKDKGIGIDKNDLPHIFERFYRADTSRSHSQNEGYGLGLAIAKRIVDIHKGDIQVVSELNKGTTFTVVLPIKK
jgi:signal transduction histidine kinase